MNDAMMFTIIDIVYALLLVGFGYKGYRKGFFKEFVGLLGMILGLAISLRVLPAMTPFLVNLLNFDVGASAAIGVVVVFFGVLFFYQLIEKLIYKYAELNIKGALENWLSTAIGLVKGLLMASLAAMCLALLPFKQTIKDQVAGSAFHPHAERFAPAIYNSTRKFMPGSKEFIIYFEDTASAFQPANLDDDLIQFLTDLGSTKAEQWKPRATR